MNHSCDRCKRDIAKVNNFNANKGQGEFTFHYIIEDETTTIHKYLCIECLLELKKFLYKWIAK